MIKYKTKITSQTNDSLIDIILNNPYNTQKRKKIKKLYLTFGIFSFIMGFPSLVGQLKINGIIFVLFSALLILISYKIKTIQKIVIKLKHKKIFKKQKIKEKEIEYEFSNNGIEIKTNNQNNKNSWDEFKLHGTYKNFIYIERNDGKFIVLDIDKLSKKDVEELNDIFENVGLSSSDKMI